jgi:hypothetical protein
MTREVEAMLLGGDARLKGLSNPAHRCLIWMALNARDSPTDDLPGGCYFRGWEHLARMLGYPDTGPTAERATMRALAELQQADLIKVVGRRHGARGKRVYRLHLILTR